MGWPRPWSTFTLIKTTLCTTELTKISKMTKQNKKYRTHKTQRTPRANRTLMDKVSYRLPLPSLLPFRLPMRGHSCGPFGRENLAISCSRTRTRSIEPKQSRVQLDISAIQWQVAPSVAVIGDHSGCDRRPQWQWSATTVSLSATTVVVAQTCIGDHGGLAIGGHRRLHPPWPGWSLSRLQIQTLGVPISKLYYWTNQTKNAVSHNFLH